MKYKKIIYVVLGVLFVMNLIWPGGLIPGCDRDQNPEINTLADIPTETIKVAENIDECTPPKSTFEEAPYIYTWQVTGYFIRTAKEEVRASPRGTYKDIFYVNQEVETIGSSQNFEELIIGSLELPDSTAVPVDKPLIEYINRRKLIY